MSDFEAKHDRAPKGSANGGQFTKMVTAEADDVDLSPSVEQHADGLETRCIDCGAQVSPGMGGSCPGGGAHAGVPVRSVEGYRLREGDVACRDGEPMEQVHRVDRFVSVNSSTVYVWRGDADPGDDDAGEEFTSRDQDWQVVDRDAQDDREREQAWLGHASGRVVGLVTGVSPKSLRAGDVVVVDDDITEFQGFDGDGRAVVRDSRAGLEHAVDMGDGPQTKVIVEDDLEPWHRKEPAAITGQVLTSDEARAEHRNRSITDDDIARAIEAKRHAVTATTLSSIGRADSPAMVQQRADVAADVYRDAVEMAGNRRGPMCGDHRWGYGNGCPTCTDGEGRPNTLPNQIDPRYWREQAAMLRERSRDSFERSDTDGALSQWSSDTEAQRCDLQAQVCENGGAWKHLALFRADGTMAPAKLVDGRYGQSWAMLSDDDDPQSAFTGEFVGRSKAATGAKRAEAMAKKGYREGYVWAKSRAELGGGGKGLSGVASVRPYVRRTDGGFDKDADFAGFVEEDDD